MKILGIGNALVDIILFLENESLLTGFSLPRGSMQLVDAQMASEVEAAAGSCQKHMASGGSAANTIHGLARLGVETAFMGTVGTDSFGDFFRRDMESCGIVPLLASSDTSTGRAISLVTPGGERTFTTYLGAAVELAVSNLTPDLFRGYHHLHLEGYLVPNQQLVEKAFVLARQNNMSVSLDMASFNVVEANHSFLDRIIRQYKPIIFANEEEAKAFTSMIDPAEAIDYFAGLTDTAIVKIGSRGSLITHQGKRYSADVLRANCIDTTGAGDLYAAGYLYGMANNMSPEKCGTMGSLLAGKVIEEAGAKISDAGWDYIRKNLRI